MFDSVAGTTIRLEPLEIDLLTQTGPISIGDDDHGSVGAKIAKQQSELT